MFRGGQMSSQWERDKLSESRHDAIVELLKSVYEKKGYIVHVVTPKYSLLDRIKKRPTGDRFYVYREGVTIVNRKYKKAPLDIMVYKNGQLHSVWELCNYAKDTFMLMYKFRRYIDNLTLRDCNRFLVVTSPSNFRMLDYNKSPEENIEWAEKELAKNKIFLIYWEYQHPIKEQLEGWIE
jgi:hypothetical protein